MKTTSFFIGLFVLTSLISSSPQYKIDPTISTQIDSLINASKLSKDDLKPDFLFAVEKPFKYEDFKIDDASDLSYFLETNSLLNRQFTGSHCDCFLKGDSIIIQGGLGYAGGVFFRVKIYQDNFDSEVLFSTTKDVYTKRTDTLTYVKDIVLTPLSQSMTLAEKPILKVGKSVKGRASLIVEPFYQLDKNNKLRKLDVEFDLIFDTKIEERSSH